MMHRFMDVCCALFATGSLATTTTSAITLTPIAVTDIEGSVGPGVEVGTMFESFGAPVVDASGRVVFDAMVYGPSLPSGGEGGFWIHDGGANAIKIRSSDNSPFTGAQIGQFSFFVPANTSENDVVGSTLVESLVNVGGVTSTLTHTTMQAAGTGPGVFYGFAERVFVNGLGQYGFRSPLTGAVTASDSLAAYVGAPGALSLVARTGNAAPGLSGLTLSSIFSVRMAWDGGYGFDGAVAGPGVDFTNNQAIWAGTPGSLAPVARLGEQAPGFPAGAAFEFFSTYSIADSAGTTVFKGETTGGGVTSDDDEGIWVGAPGSVNLLLREGDQIPGLPAGVLLDSFQFSFSSPSIDDSARMTFRAPLKGPGVGGNDFNAILWGPAGALQVVARLGDAAPDLPGFTFENFSQFAASNSGHVLILALITDGSQFSSALYVWHESTGLTLVAASGDMLDLGMGDVRPIVNFAIADAEFDGAGLATSIGRDGTIAFRAGTLNPTGEVILRADVSGGSPADFNGDGVVDGMDLAALLAAWGVCPPPCPQDLNGDGNVDGMDLAALLAAWS